MKKILINVSMLLTVVGLSACSNESQVKGSDYISTNVGSTYNYESTSLDGHKLANMYITVEKCNENNTSCNYISKIVDTDDKAIEGSEYKYSYTIKNGAVYRILPNVADEELFPEDIKFNVIKAYNNSTEDFDVSGSYSFTKQISEVTVNNTTYKNCIEISGKSISKFNDKNGEIINTQNIESKEIYCKNTGLVKENVSTTDDSGNSTNTVVNLLSITKGTDVS